MDETLKNEHLSRKHTHFHEGCALCVARETGKDLPKPPDLGVSAGELVKSQDLGIQQLEDERIEKRDYPMGRGVVFSPEIVDFGRKKRAKSGISPQTLEIGVYEAFHCEPCPTSKSHETIDLPGRVFEPRGVLAYLRSTFMTPQMPRAPSVFEILSSKCQATVAF